MTLSVIKRATSGRSVTISAQSPELHEDLAAKEIRTRISDNIGVYFPELDGAVDAVEIAGVARRRYSTIFYIRLTVGSAAKADGLVAKHFHGHGDDRTLAAHQYASMVEAFRAIHDRNLATVPRPVDFLADLPAIIMERVDGTSIQNLLGIRSWVSGNAGAAVPACAASAEWLRRFHAVTLSPPSILDVETKLKSAIVNLTELEKLRFPRSLCGALATVLEKDADKLVNRSLETAKVHGDFTVDNVLKCHSRYVVLDVTGEYCNSTYHDVATFLNSLLLVRLSSPILAVSLRQCAQTFLTTYFTNAAFDPTPLRFLRLAGLISSAIEISRWQSHRPLVRTWIRRSISAFFTQLIAESADFQQARFTPARRASRD